MLIIKLIWSMVAVVALPFSLLLCFLRISGACHFHSVGNLREARRCLSDAVGWFAVAMASLSWICYVSFF